jgi:drug/metabolite transporter (DMT)-like permease
MSQARQGLIFIFFAVLGYSFLPEFTAPLYDAGMQPLEIALWRYTITTPLFWGMAWMQGRREQREGRPLPRVTVFFMGILLALAALCAFFGLDLIPAGTYVVIFYTYPAIVALIALFLGDRLSRWGWAAVALSIVGVMLTAPDFSSGIQGDNFLGVIISLINAVIVAVYFILSGRIFRGLRNVTAAGAMACTGALATLLVIGLFTGVRPPPSLTEVVVLFGMAIVSTLLPIFAISHGVPLLGPARAAVVGSFEPLLTAFLAMIFLDQQMASQQWLGGLVIVASVILLQTLGSRPAASTPPGGPPAP